MIRHLGWVVLAGALCSAQRVRADDPLISSWFTVNSDRLASIYPDDAAKMEGQAVTTWDNGRTVQPEPAYCGVQAVLTSKNWVYICSTGLGSQVMGPWYFDPWHQRLFPNLPTDQHLILRLPRHPVMQAANGKGLTTPGETGMFVDGVSMFDATDTFSYSNENGRDADPRARIGRGDHVWNRNAYINEGITFDAGLGHQQQWGHYHYHAEAIALRYMLGDHVDFDPATKTYGESKTPPSRHSPILAWMHDGYPVYGPYGFSNPTNAVSGIRRMVSGYVARGELRQTGRQSLPAWVAREFHRPAALIPEEYGPDVSVTYPLGHYLEDYAYLGDVGKSRAKHWDLDEFNGRWCVTPDFPKGTYAYFTTIDAAGNPVFPYNMGRRYRGVPTGRLVNAINEPVTTNFVARAGFVAKPPPDRTLTLRWQPGPEGGDYRPGPPR